MRKLATIQRIAALSPIEGADSIEVAKVLGWNVVVKKGEFTVGQLCVYCEIDSLMPDLAEFEFLKPRGMRIRTVRLRGQVSQGICFPIGLLVQFGLVPCLVQEGDDVSEAMGITKYEPPTPASLSGKIKGQFPSFIFKTDETRVQVLQPLLTKYKGTRCYITEKLDGSSVTYYLKDGVFGVCSRNLDLLEEEGNSFWKVARALDIENKLKMFGVDVALQGELIGEGIQKNIYKLKGQTVKFFNLFFIKEARYADYHDFMKLMVDVDLEQHIVPGISCVYELTDNIEELVKLATAKSSLNKDVWREGIVIRPLEEITELDDNGLLHKNRLSFKAINPEFLLKYE